MKIEHHFSLKPYNTFGIDVPAKAFASFASIGELWALLHEVPEGAPLLVLGGGSNMLFTKPFDGWVLHNSIPGIEVMQEDDDFWYVRAGAGENWHGFVLKCIEEGWCGVENLSLIPGSVGASPMQNIGAYGVEIKDFVDTVEAIYLPEKTLVRFDREACAFGYRDSIFKRGLRHKCIITAVTFALRKKPVYNTSYGAIGDELTAMGIQEPSCRAISDAVIRIRRRKLPDPALTGNAGSFFKNPEIDARLYLELKQIYPDLPGFPGGAYKTKVPAGYLIEKAGWKGYREGDAGVHPLQALVLVNYGNATGQQIFDLSEKILLSVQQDFGITLEREVNIY